MGGCCSSMGEGLKSLTAYKLIMIANFVIGIFGLVMFALGIAALVEFSEDNFFSREIYGMMILFGLASFVLVFLACVGAKAPKEHPNYLFCYWCLVSLLIVGNLVTVFAFNTFIDSLDNANGGNGELSVLELQFAKQSNDFVLSVYTACCTGCDQVALPDVCLENIAPGDFTGGDVFCDQNGTDPCDLAEPCVAADFDVGVGGAQDGLGQGCFITIDQIPGFDVGVDTCSVFEEIELVGDSAGGRCGGGDPTVFVANTVDYFQDRYFRIVIPWGFFIALLCLAWLASVFMIMFHSGGRSK